jgi:outer membrane protein assembly factor BamE (lipoprotein component of BamABCDE complex)
MKTVFFSTSARSISSLIIAVLILSITGCFTVGHDFPVDQVSSIKTGKTTQEDIRSMFGSPWRIGMEDGHRTWTYGKYIYSAFSETKTQDLVIRFNDQGKVASFTFNTTEHQE